MRLRTTWLPHKAPDHAAYSRVSMATAMWRSNGLVTNTLELQRIEAVFPLGMKGNPNDQQDNRISDRSRAFEHRGARPVNQGKAGAGNNPTNNPPAASGNMNQDNTAGAVRKSRTTKMQKSSAGSSKDASTQGAGTAGAAQKKGDATTPGGAMQQ